MPPDFAAALAAEPAAQATFDTGSAIRTSRGTSGRSTARKSDETRQRRIAKSVEALRAGAVR